jgi:hypothetical protein
MILLNAAWASSVMESASSKIINLKGGQGYLGLVLKVNDHSELRLDSRRRFGKCFNLFSNDINASFIRSIQLKYFDGHEVGTRRINHHDEYGNNSFARAKTADVFPVPGGP